MQPNQPIRVFVVDDHEVVRMGLKTMLESEPDIRVVGMAAGVREALKAIGDCEVDIVLTDLHMGEIDGDVLITEVRNLKPGLQAVVLTNYHSDEDVLRAIRAGAMAYLLKSSSMAQVVGAIRDVRQGKTVIPPYIAEQLVQAIRRNPPSVREAEILQLLVHGMNNDEIAAKLSISRNTVRNHVGSILGKLGTRDRAEATAVAIKRGLVRVSDD
jgi:two-component system NarL family response regulator